MFDKELVHSILEQTDDALEKVKTVPRIYKVLRFLPTPLKVWKNLILYACCLLQSVRV